MILEHINTFHFFNKYKILEAEEKHEFLFDNISFIAIPDFVGYDPSGDFIILDHKISKLWTKKEVEKKKRQLYVYSIPIQNKYNKLPKKFQVNFFKENKIITYDFNNNEFNKTKKWIHNKVEEIENHIIKNKEYIPRCKIVKNAKYDFFANFLCNHRKSCIYKK